MLEFTISTASRVGYGAWLYEVELIQRKQPKMVRYSYNYFATPVLYSVLFRLLAYLLSNLRCSSSSLIELGVSTSIILVILPFFATMSGLALLLPTRMVLGRSKPSMSALTPHPLLRKVLALQLTDLSCLLWPRLPLLAIFIHPKFLPIHLLRALSDSLAQGRQVDPHVLRLL